MFLNFGEHMAPLSPRLLRLRPPPPCVPRHSCPLWLQMVTMIMVTMMMTARCCLSCCFVLSSEDALAHPICELVRVNCAGHFHSTVLSALPAGADNWFSSLRLVHCGWSAVHWPVNHELTNQRCWWWQCWNSSWLMTVVLDASSSSSTSVSCGTGCVHLYSGIPMGGHVLTLPRLYSGSWDLQRYDRSFGYWGWGVMHLLRGSTMMAANHDDQRQLGEIWPTMSWIWRFPKSMQLVFHVFIAVAVLIYLVAVMV